MNALAPRWRSETAPRLARPPLQVACASPACAIRTRSGAIAVNRTVRLQDSARSAGNYCARQFATKRCLPDKCPHAILKKSRCGACLLAKVLVIEDDEETAEEIVTALGDRGYVLDRAADGADGLQRARVGGWDVLVVDRMLLNWMASA